MKQTISHLPCPIVIIKYYAEVLDTLWNIGNSSWIHYINDSAICLKRFCESFDLRRRRNKYNFWFQPDYRFHIWIHRVADLGNRSGFCRIIAKGGNTDEAIAAACSEDHFGYARSERNGTCDPHRYRYPASEIVSNDAHWNSLGPRGGRSRSEEHTSELQSRFGIS